MLALRCIEENVANYRETESPIVENILARDNSEKLDVFETACKAFATPTEVIASGAGSDFSLGSEPC